MTGAAVLLMCLLLISSVDGIYKLGRYQREPDCGDMSRNQVCTLNYRPVCGSDGITYPNECALCARRMQTNADILIVKEGRC